MFVRFELRMATDLGVNVHYNSPLGNADGEQSVSSFKEQGYDAVFLGMGLAAPKVPKEFQGGEEGILTAKSFLPKVSEAAKGGMCSCKVGNHVLENPSPCLFVRALACMSWCIRLPV